MKKVILPILLMLLPLMVKADDSGLFGDNLDYSYDTLHKILTIYGNGPMKDYNVYSNYSPWSGFRNEIQTIIIKEGVTSIGNNAFYECRAVTSITIPSSVTSIGESALYGCSALTSITVPNSVTSIRREAFQGTAWYNNLPDGLVYAGKVAYKYKGEMPDNTHVMIQEGTTEIADDAFQGYSGLTAITLPNSVTSIGEFAFKNCSALTSITIPNSVTSIGRDAFIGTVWYNNQPEGLVYAGKVAYKYKGEMSENSHITIQEGTLEIADIAFYNCFGLTSITIPNSVTSIGIEAFSGCSSLTSVTIPNSVTTIGAAAFSYCSALTSVTIPSSVTSIRESAFSGCSALTSVTIPNNLSSIAPYVFQGCSGLTSVTIPSSVIGIGDYAFRDCKGLSELTIPNNVKAIGTGTFSRCEKMETLNLPNSLTTIGEKAFLGCNGLKTLHIPAPLTSIGSGAFSGCNGLKTLYIPPTLTSIGSGAFSGCNGLTSITVDYGNMVYDSRYDCNAIIESATNTLLIGCNKSTIPNSIQIIGDYAFQNCKELKTIKIPKTVKRIGLSAFSGCGLTNIEIPNSVTEMYRYAFSGSELTSIILPNSITSIYYGTFENCSYLTSIDIPNSVTNIESRAFHSCRELKTITIPINVTMIGECAFEYCNSLTSIVLPKNIKEIRGYAFNTISPLSDVYCLAEDVPNGSSFYLPYGNNSTLHVPAGSIEKYKNTPTLNNFANIVALTEEELAIYDTKSSQPELSKTIEGIYQVQATSDRNGTAYGRAIEVTVIDNGDGTITFDDVFGGWYDVRANNWDGYGSNYKMGATIAVADDGNMQLLNSYIPGWGNSLDTFEGFYDAESGTVSLVCLYAETYKFTEKWIKVCDLFMIDGIVYGIGEDNTVSVKKWNYSGDITIPEEVTYKGTVYKVTSIGKSSYTTPLGDYWYETNDKVTFSGAFRGSAAILSVTLPNSVTRIGESDFENCPALLSVNIPNSVTSIGYRAFSNCPALNSMNIPTSVLSIDEQAFYNCTGLTSMSIPSSVTTIFL